MAAKLQHTPYNDIILIPLHHLRSAIAAQGLTLGADESRELANALATSSPHPKKTALLQALSCLVNDSLHTLQQRWQLDFATALRTNAADLGSWETTAELLALANEKAEAESQIALGAALLLAAGQREYAKYLIDVIEDDAGALDVDAAIAKRVLLHASAVDGAADDWLAQVKRWLPAPTSSPDPPQSI